MSQCIAISSYNKKPWRQCLRSAVDGNLCTQHFDMAFSLATYYSGEIKTIECSKLIPECPYPLLTFSTMQTIMLLMVYIGSEINYENFGPGYGAARNSLHRIGVLDSTTNTLTPLGNKVLALLHDDLKKEIESDKKASQLGAAAWEPKGVRTSSHL